MDEGNSEKLIELEITARVTIPEGRYARFLSVLREISIEPVHIQVVDQGGNALLFDLQNQEFQLETMTQAEANYVRKRFIEDDAPNNVSTTGFKLVWRNTPEDKRTLDKNKQPFSVDTATAVEVCKGLLFGKGAVKGPKTRGFLQAFLAYGEEKLRTKPSD